MMPLSIGRLKVYLQINTGSFAATTKFAVSLDYLPNLFSSVRNNINCFSSKVADVVFETRWRVLQSDCVDMCTLFFAYTKDMCI